MAAKKESLGSLQESCKIHSCTLISDAWTNLKGVSIINLVLNSYSESMSYELENTLKDVHNEFFIYNLINNTIEKIEDGCLV